ncbi:MAG: MogA/MoaB family molybdenum cofactor biosynthesis protein [Syntrophales bacterium]|jgi:molybdenum cofactor synthesis domain-containing protein|nr:MogA/MoaB family molybdenum cofactor biosynthesis protein [Syntrophales bacterium]NLN60546.1 MogA/MoaB family molybdenum cofactor biosynthesis protein [Deltaproteobacteria bacterium]
MPFTFGIITVSDKGARGERLDTSGQEIRDILGKEGFYFVDYTIVQDEVEQISAALVAYADQKKIDLIVTTGGTGVSPSDVTPEATMGVIDKEIPGMSEAMRRESVLITPHAMISRAVVGIRGESLIINLPGSPKGVRENLATVLPALGHAIEKIKGDPSDCSV